MSVATLVEISVVIEARHGAEAQRDRDHFIARAGIEVAAVDAEHGGVIDQMASLDAKSPPGGSAAGR